MLIEIVSIFAPTAAFFGAITAIVYGGPVLSRVKYRVRNQTVGAKGLADYDVMEPIIASLKEFPTEWKITPELVRFPRAGNAAQVSLTLQDNHYNVSVQGDAGNKDRPVSSYYNELLKQLIPELTVKRVSVDVNSMLYPNGRDQLLLTSQEKE
jgi:hypothetical protein